MSSRIKTLEPLGMKKEHLEFSHYEFTDENSRTNWGQVYLYQLHELIGEAAFSFGIPFTDK